jgi:hypothetical protein
MLEVKITIFEYLTLTFDSLTMIWEIMFDTMKNPPVPKYPYQV